MSITPATPATFLTAAWRWLAVLNYEIDPALLEPLVPRGTTLDFDAAGKTYVSLVGFRFENTRVLGWSMPGHRKFEELNLRFYVTRHEGGEERRGVVFIKELVPRVAISTVARWAYNENYHTVPMRHQLTGCDSRESTRPEANYEFYHAGAWNRLGVKCASVSFVPDEDSHEAFILEHYWGYCRQRDGGTIEYRVDHPRWHVWPATEAVAGADFTKLYGASFAAILSQSPTSALLADGSPVSVAKPRRLAEASVKSVARAS